MLSLMPFRALSVGTYEVGELRRRGALGQPHSYSEVPLEADSGLVYAGNDVFACVARHDRMWKGESMEISKCLRLPGFSASGLERRITILIQ